MEGKREANLAPAFLHFCPLKVTTRGHLPHLSPSLPYRTVNQEKAFISQVALLGCFVTTQQKGTRTSLTLGTTQKSTKQYQENETGVKTIPETATQH